MNNNGLFEIALFPIPGSVNFPQTIVPLHVFEPRYRQMIQDCIDKNMLLGVCHTQSIERFAKSIKTRASSIDEAYLLYKQNLSTYKPEDIFSAGPVDITEKTEDGRYLISIHMLKRFRIVNIIQDKPYKIGLCEEYSDDFELEFVNASERVVKQKELIINFLKDQLVLQEVDGSEDLEVLSREKSVNKFSFKLFGYLRFQDFRMQQILQSTNPVSRLEEIYQVIVTLASNR
jgi:Lon protease-like protein